MLLIWMADAHDAGKSAQAALGSARLKFENRRAQN
jgi:hypothetical protein